MAEEGQNISWSVETHEHKEHTADWFWGFGILAALGIGLSVYFGNILLAVILLIGACSLAILIVRGPREHTVVVDRRGITMDGTLYPYSSVHSFWVDEEHGSPRLFITTSGILSPHLSIPLNDATHARSVRHLLKRFTEEEEQGPHFGEHLAELLGL